MEEVPTSAAAIGSVGTVEAHAIDRQILAREASALAARNIYVGTSSWKYEGWLGPFYTPSLYETRGKHSTARFERECLKEYATVFKSVCVDAGFYRFPSPAFLRALDDSVPEDFRFAFKVTEDITIKTFPRLPRHGDRAGKPNPHFLDAQLFQEAFLAPLETMRPKVGLLIFEFSRMYRRDYERGRDFVADLSKFLLSTNPGWPYAVEIRNAEFLQPEYFAALHAANTVHVISSWTRMPPAIEQMRLAPAADRFAARFLLTPGRTYEQAVSTFSPYTTVRAPDPVARESLKLLLREKPKSPSFAFVNNRLEGNALATIQAAVNAPET